MDDKNAGDKGNALGGRAGRGSVVPARQHREQEHHARLRNAHGIPGKDWGDCHSALKFFIFSTTE